VIVDPNTVQPWMPWAVVATLLLLGAWMRMGSSLLALGAAAVVALAEAVAGYGLRVQIASFATASCILALLQWAHGRARGAGTARRGGEREQTPGR
jgi:membrane protein implicated in regulation of membrane protease activity